MCNTHGKAGGLTKISRNPFPSQPINWAGHCIASNGSDRPSDIGPKDPTLGRLFKMSTEIVLLLTTIYRTSRLLAIKKFCWYLQTNVFGFRLKRGFDSSFGFPWPSAGKSGNRTVVGFRKNVLGAFVRKKKTSSFISWILLAICWLEWWSKGFVGFHLAPNSPPPPRWPLAQGEEKRNLFHNVFFFWFLKKFVRNNETNYCRFSW